MRTIQKRRGSTKKILWVLVTAALALSCTCPLFAVPTPAVPSPTTLPPLQLTYTLYPTYTPLPSQIPVNTAPPPALQPSQVKPPVKTLANTPVVQPPVKNPTTTSTEPPPPPGGGSSGIAKSDLEITNIGPVSTTRADKVFVDLKNHGPHAFSGQIHVVCVGQGFLRPDPSQMVPTASDEWINLNLDVGTSFFYPGMIINTPVYFYSPIQCTIEVPDNKDPNPNNNSYAISIP